MLEISNHKGWIERRELSKITIDNNILSLKKEDLNIENLKKHHFSDDEILQITSKIKDDNKKQFCNMVCELDKDVLISVSYLLKDVLEKLKISTIA